MLTCDRCLSGHHVRCTSRLACGCSMCGARRRTARRPETTAPPPPLPGLPKERAERTKTLSDDPKAVYAREYRRKKAASKKQGDSTPSDSPKAAYMREYRRKKAAGEAFKKYRKVPQETLDQIVNLHEQGMGVRKIGEIIEMDYSQVNRLLKREKERRAEESNP